MKILLIIKFKRVNHTKIDFFFDTTNLVQNTICILLTEYNLTDAILDDINNTIK
jgi:hypothetical protein